MSQFFSAIVTRDGDVRWCEDDSHETILTRLGWPDNRPLETRGWVRVECVPPHTCVHVDETRVPGWYAEDRARVEGVVMDRAHAVAPALAAYEAACAPARGQYLAPVDGFVPRVASYHTTLTPAQRDAQDETDAFRQRGGR